MHFPNVQLEVKSFPMTQSQFLNFFIAEENRKLKQEQQKDTSGHWKDEL